MRNPMLLFLVIVFTAAAVPADDRPNFVVMVADDLGYGDLGSYGHLTVRTPNIDRLAEQGLRFTDGYAAAPVCSPARTGLLTGRIPSRVGVYDWIPPGSDVHLPAEETTIAELLRDAGYQTVYLGKWHLNGGLGTDQPQPDDHGFDHWFATTGFAMPTHLNPFNFALNGVEMGPMEGYACQLLSDEAVRWLNELRDPERPFVMVIGYHEPHEAIASPPDITATYPATQNRNEAEYFANITNLDLAVGRVIDTLDSLALADDTMVIFTSDNGPEMVNRHPQAQRSYGSAGGLRGRKLQLWEGGIRVPFIVRWPERTGPGGVSSTPVSGIDLLPTLCELAGVGVPDAIDLDSTSFAPALTGASIDRTTPLFWHDYKAWGGPRVVLRDGRFKLAGYWDGPEILRTDSSTMRPGDCELIRTAKLVFFELYDLESDPGERHDVADEHPEVVSTMKAEMLSIYGEIQAEVKQWEESWLRRW
jgi:arylsulfatase A